MEIYGLPPGGNRIESIDGKQKVDSSKAPKRAVTENVQRAPQGKDRVEDATFVVATEFEPRLDLSESVTRRLTGGKQSGPAVTEATGEQPASDLPNDSNVNVENRGERNEEGDRNFSNNYYESATIARQIAENISPIVDLSGLLSDQL